LDRKATATPSRVGGEAGKCVVIWSPCAVAALDPPLWIIVPERDDVVYWYSIRKLSLSLSLSLIVQRDPIIMMTTALGLANVED
jgi:hypothetical protein